MERLLKDFCSQSSQKVNLGNTVVFFIQCVPSTSVKGNISTTFGIPISTNLGMYLGMPVLHKSVSSGTYDFLVENLEKKLSNWKGRMMSMAARAILIQTSAAAFSSYAMQTSRTPVSTLNQLMRFTRYFLWGSSAGQRTMYTVS